MPRAAVMTLALVAAIAALTISFAVSPAAKRLVGNIAERQIEEALGRRIEIGAVQGDLFHEFQLVNVRFKNGGESWAEIARVEISWNPRALFGRKIEISSLSIEDAKILAQPPPGRNAKPFKGLELPERLPALSINEFRISNLVVDRAVAGESIRLDGRGSVAMGGRALSVSGSLSAADDRDNLWIEVKRNPATGDIALEAHVRSTPQGAIAALANAGGAIDVSANGGGPNEDFSLQLRGAFGDAGAFEAQARSNLATLEAIDLTLIAEPGVRFSDLTADLGESITAEGVYRPLDRGGRLDLRRVSLAAGALTGEIYWRNSRNALELANADLSFALAENWRSPLQAVIGDTIDVKTSIERRGGAFSVTAFAMAPFLGFSLLEGESDLRTRLDGEIELKAEPASSLSQGLASGFAAAAGVAFKRGDEIALKSLRVASASGLKLEGDIGYAFSASQISAKGTLTLDGNLLSGLLQSLHARGKLVAEFDARGAADDLALQMTATVPAMVLNGATLPPSRAAVSLAGLPASASGVVSIRALDGSRRASTNISRRPDGLWRFRSIDYRGNGFAMRGELDFNPGTGEGGAGLSYEGADEAEPWPGVIVEGAANASGALSRSSQNNRLSFEVAALRRGGISVEGLQYTASGAFEKLSFDASAVAFSAADRAQLRDVRLSGAIASTPRTVVTLATATADFNGSPVALASPASLAFSDGFDVRGLKLRIGKSGVAELDGAFSRSHWRATAEIRDVRLQDSLTTAGFFLDLDTHRIPKATGRLEVKSAITRTKALTFPGEFTWDGRQLKVLAKGADRALHVDLTLPLVLKGADRLSLVFDGPISGSARYQGRAESIAVFMPAPLQTLEGMLDFAGSVSGDVRNPRVDGKLLLIDGAYTELSSGFSFIDIDLTAVAEGSVEASAVQFSATASGAGQAQKSITASGSLDLRDDLRLTATLNLDRARFSGGPIESVNASGAVTVEGDPDDMLVSGDLDIHALTAELFTTKVTGLVDIDVVALNGDGLSSSQGPTKAQQKGTLRYAIRLTSDDNIVVRGRGLNSTWRANAQIAGDREQPLVLGALNLRRGDLEFSGRRFDLTRGSIGFDTFAPNDPTIDVRAERETRDGVTVAVLISGRSSALKISLESTPSSSNDDIMALILFDKPADQLSAFESLQVADALTQLGGVGVFGGKGVAGAARDALGLDLLNLEIDEADSAASLLTVGKYVTDGLFISASQSARGENGSLRIEYEIGPSFSVETELRQDGDQTISANWKRDF